MGVRTRTLRGAVSGAVAAAVWALEQPLDKLLLDSTYDDVEVLGKWVTRGPAWYPVGLVWHMGNGALFGAVYSNVATSVPLPPVLRGPVVSLAEHVAAWPLGSLSDRLHPARRQLPDFRGNRRAFAQGVVRHLVFGITLGELERRLNAGSEPSAPAHALNVSSNGHGSIEHAATGQRTQ